MADRSRWTATPTDDERDPRELGARWHLPENRDADRCRGRRQQRDEQRVGRPLEPRHRKLVTDVRDDRGRDPDTDPRRERNRVDERGQRLPAADRRHDDERDQHRGRQAVDPADALALRDAVAEDDVRGEEDGVRQRERNADRLALELDVGEEVDAADCECQRGGVPPRPRAECGERDYGQEFDRRDRAERQPVDRQVEAHVHHRQDGAPGDKRPPASLVETGDEPPRSPPDREDGSRGGDPEPGDAEDVDPCEEQHRERRPEVVEDRAADEVGVRREPEERMEIGSPSKSREWPARDEGVRTQMATKQRQNDRSTFDPTDAMLLAELQEDARLTHAELGRRVNLSAPAVAERLRRLERSGVITGYRADVDPKALGYALGVIMRIRPSARQLHKVAELARETPEVVECHRITGEDCFFMKLHVRDVEQLEEILDRFILYGQTTTSIIQSSPVPRRGPRSLLAVEVQQLREAAVRIPALRGRPELVGTDPELEQVQREIAPLLHRHAQPLDRAARLDDRAAVLPEETGGPGAELLLPDRLTKAALLRCHPRCHARRMRLALTRRHR